MTTVKKVLFIGTYPDQASGYGRVANQITNHLARMCDYQKYKVVHFGYHNVESSRVKHGERRVDPAIELIDVLHEEKRKKLANVYGDEIINDVVSYTKPDVVIIYNDVLVTTRMLNKLNTLRQKSAGGDGTVGTLPFKLVAYLDLVYEYERSDCVEFVCTHVDEVWTFSDFWKTHIEKVMHSRGIKGVDGASAETNASAKNTASIHVLPHGVDVQGVSTHNPLSSTAPLVFTNPMDRTSTCAITQDKNYIRDSDNESDGSAKDEYPYYSMSNVVHEARAKFGISATDFVILNANRNTYRKALDLTLRAFLMFLRTHAYDDTLKLFLTCNMETTSGYNVLSVIRDVCVELDMDYDRVVQKHVLIPRERPVSDTDLRLLQIVCDVGLNTCVGEGFGLCSIEHAFVGARPQIVSGVGALTDLFEDKKTGLVIPPVASYTVSNHTDVHNGLARVCLASDFADAIEWCYTNKGEAAKLGLAAQQKFGREYRWGCVLKTLEAHMDRLLEKKEN